MSSNWQKNNADQMYRNAERPWFYIFYSPYFLMISGELYHFHGIINVICS